MILNNCYYKVSMLLIYLDMIIISVVVIVGGAHCGIGSYTWVMKYRKIPDKCDTHSWGGVMIGSKLLE